MLPAGNGTFQLSAGNKPGDAPLATAQSYRYSNYVELPLGKVHLSVVKSGGTTPLKAFDLDVKPDSYFTVLVAPQRIDVFDDTDNPKEQAGTLMVRNFFPGAPVTVLSGQQTVVQALAYGQTYPLTGLPLAKTTFTLRTILPDNKPAEASVDADFKSSKRATLLIIPDSYGRFRPRLTPDGSNP